MPHSRGPLRASHTLPFPVEDLDEFIRQVDSLPTGVDNISMSEETVEGRQMVRLYAESGNWPDEVDLPDLISSHLPQNEIAVVVSTNIDDAAHSDVSLVAIDNSGETMHSSFEDMVTDFQDSARTLGMGGGFRQPVLVEEVDVLSVEDEDDDGAPEPELPVEDDDE